MAEARATVSVREFAAWKVFYSLHPWGEERADLRTGIIASMLLRRWGRGSARSSKPSDFVLRGRWRGHSVSRAAQQSAEDMQAILWAFAAMHNARLARAGGPE